MTRPTSGRLREALFNICRNEIEGAAFLDLFAGSGAMGLEALSRGARQACFVDNNRESIRCIQSNLTTFDATKSGDVLFSDVFSAMKKLAKLGRQFDVIYADPPYDTVASKNQEHVSLSAQVLTVLDELIEAGQPLLKRGGILFLEDDVQALPEEKILKHLAFKDTRVMGRSALQCWYYH